MKTHWQATNKRSAAFTLVELATMARRGPLVGGPVVTEPANNHRPRGREAFTLLELLVVVSFIGICLAMMDVSHAGTKSSGRSFQCLANTKQLMLANLLYQSDNREEFPMVFHGGFVPSANRSARPWVTGWLDWSAATDNTNELFLTEKPYSSLAAYCGRDKRLFKCPADVFVSGVQRARGWTGRVRSISANLFVGKGNAWYTDTTAGYSVGGPGNLSIYRGVTKASELAIPGPARTWVYMDEHPDSMNDAGGFPPDSGTNIPDIPATYHNGAAGFAMADGHSEMHQWRGPLMTKPANNVGAMGVSFRSQNNWPTTYGDPDLYWYSYASPRVSTRTVAD